MKTMRNLLIFTLFIGIVGLVLGSYVALKEMNLGGRSAADTEGIGVSIYDDTSVGMARLDSATEALETIDYAHHEIHAGSHYFVVRSKFTTDIGASTTVVFKTPNSTKWAHLTYSISTEKMASTTLFSNIATTTTGTILTPQNSDENSSKTATVQVALDATASTTYAINRCTYAASTTPCIVEQFVFGSTGVPQSPGRGGSADRENEIILKANTVYALVIHSLSADDSWNTIRLNWYEHTNRN